MSLTYAPRSAPVRKQAALRPGVIIRFTLVAVVALVLVLEGAAIKSRVTEGPSHTYVAVLRANADQYSVGNELAAIEGLKTKSSVTAETAKGFVVIASEDDAHRLLSVEGVSYIEMGQKMEAHQNWWEQLMTKAGL